MIRLIAVAAFALGLATAVQAMPVAPLHQQPDGLYTQARVYHGVARRHVRRAVRRCALWRGGACVRYY
jgi:hypothetical protein